MTGNDQYKACSRMLLAMEMLLSPTKNASALLESHALKSTGKSGLGEVEKLLDVDVRELQPVQQAALAVIALLISPLSCEQETPVCRRLLSRLVCPVLVLESAQSFGEDTMELRAALLSAKSKEGMTLYLAAAKAGNEVILRTLFELNLLKGAQTHETDAHHRTAMQLAVEAGPSSSHTEAISLLMKHAGLLPDPERTTNKEWSDKIKELQVTAGSNSKLLDGRYQKWEMGPTASSGGSKSVEIAIDSQTSRFVALKRCHSADEAEREQQILAALQAAHGDTAPVCLRQFTDKQDAEHPTYLVLQAADLSSQGQGYRAGLGQSEDALALMQMRTDARRMLHCVNAVHTLAQGYIHCDIKWEHFLRFEGHYRLLDYDSVEPAGARFEQPKDGVVPAYTVPYVSPEVARSIITNTPLTLTSAADVWACGLVLYELFTHESLLPDMVENDFLTKLSEDPQRLVISRLKAAHQKRPSKLNESQFEILSSMLVVEPEKRPTLNALLSKSFFQASVVTAKRRQGTLLALYSSPSEVRIKNGSGYRVKKVTPLDLHREIFATITVLPRDEYLVLPATRFPEDVKNALYNETMAGISPRILHFSGHGDARQQQGCLLFENEDGTMHLPTADEFIAVLKDAHDDNRLPHLECVFLNGCSTYTPLGEQLHRKLPTLTVIAWSTRVADKAANTFGQAFYRAVSPMRSGPRLTISEAFDAARDAFEEEGFKWGNPFPSGPAGYEDRTVHGCFEIIHAKPKHWQTIRRQVSDKSFAH